MSKQPENKDTIVMYGAPWCPDCRQSKQFLGDHRIQFDYINVDENPDASDKVIEINNGMRIIPTIVFPDGDVLTEPSNAELAEKLGLQTKAKRSYYDVIIIGGGPTGLTAGIYTTRERVWIPCSSSAPDWACRSASRRFSTTIQASTKESSARCWRIGW